MVTKQELHLYIAGLASDGRLTPETVLRDAKRKESPLHSSFEWDDKKAAHQHRLDTARELIRGVRLITTTETINLKSIVFVRDPRRAANDAGYVRACDLSRDAAASRAAVLVEFDRAVSAMQRARDVAGMVGQTALIDKLIETLLAGKAKIAA